MQIVDLEMNVHIKVVLDIWNKGVYNQNHKLHESSFDEASITQRNERVNKFFGTNVLNTDHSGE